MINWATAITCKRCGFYFQEVDDFAQPPQEAQSSFESDAQYHSQNEPADGFYQPEQPFQETAYQSSNQSNWSPPNEPNYYQSNYQKPKLKTGLAIASMVIGIVAFAGGCFGGFILAPIGLILGIVALVKVNKHSLQYGGKGFAIAGTVINSIVVLLIPMILALVIPNLLAARRAANEASAIYTIKTIAEAENVYRTTNKRCGDLQMLHSQNLIDSVTASGEKSGYRFIVYSLPTLNGDCSITATPISSSMGNNSFYYSTEDNVIRAAEKSGLPADQNDTPLDDNFSSSNDRQTSSQDNQGGNDSPETPPAFRGQLDEQGAISAIKVLNAAQITYMATGGAGKCGTLKDLSSAKLIGGDLAEGRKSNYVFTISTGQEQNACDLLATPLSRQNRSFYSSTNDGIIRGASKNGQAADVKDPPIQ